LSQQLVRLDLPTPADMRAPGGATGVYGLECAMDELAVKLKLDPVELRLRCYSDRDQNGGIPYTSKKLRECYAQGAEAFGWGKRSPEPRSMRDGYELVGFGMATGIWEAMQEKTAARIVLTANGHAEVSCATSDIGTGTYTIMAQLTADMLGLPIDNVTVKLGDSTLPQSPVEGGSWMAASVAGAIGAAAEKVRKELLRLAKKMKDSPFAGAKLADATLSNGKLVSKDDASRAVAVADVMRHAKLERIEQQAEAESNDNGKHARYAHSAVFAEVRVDEQLGIVRVTRIVDAVAAGRILNPKTARSQVMGGVVFGMGMALHEETLIDHRFGRFMNANLGEYHVPANADVHDIEVIFVDEPDDIINPLGIKGVGEIGVVGTAAAIANAIYHATGKRVRDIPITPDKLLM
jgi:xanthine dehydrogenase YagR molybdenum-binding subunit